MRQFGLLVALMLAVGCSAGFADRVKLYDACGKALLTGGAKAVALAQDVHGKATDAAVKDSLDKLAVSDQPPAILSACGAAAAAAKAAVEAGKK